MFVARIELKLRVISYLQKREMKRNYVAAMIEAMQSTAKTTSFFH